MSRRDTLQRGALGLAQLLVDVRGYMADDLNPLTPEQFAAARMLVARLRSEAIHEPFTFEPLGIDWLVTDDVICATTDSGELMRLGDLFYACIVMLWSMVIAHADEMGVEPLEVVGHLGLGLALHEPTQ